MVSPAPDATMLLEMPALPSRREISIECAILHSALQGTVAETL